MRFLDQKAITKIQGAIIAIIAIVALIGAAVYYVTLPSAPVSVKELKIVWASLAVTMDPQNMRATREYIQMSPVYETLTWMNITTGEPYPVLAESWSTNDLMTWTFKLKRGIKFSDGTPFNADAVKKEFDRILDPNLAVLDRGSISPPLDRMAVVDEYTVNFICSTPFPFLPGRLSHLWCASPAAFSQLETVAVGTGPFKLVEYTKGERIVLERNPDYWGEKPWLDKITHLASSQDAVRVAMLEAGEVDIAERIPPADVARLKLKPDIQIYSMPSVRVFSLGINTLKAPFTDVRVRQAINYAIDKRKIVSEIYLNTTIVADCPVAPFITGYKSTEVYEYNITKAKQLLAEAGYPNGFETVIRWGWGRIAADRDLVVAIQSMLRDAGIIARIEGMELGTYFDSITVPPEQSTQELFYFSWGNPVGDSDWYVNRVVTKIAFSPADANYFYYYNPRVDELQKTALLEKNTTKRNEDYAEIWRIVMDDAPMAWVHMDPIIMGVRKGWTNIDFSPYTEAPGLIAYIKKTA
jgi:ABC-type transport system substrate-binding protein